MTNVIRQVAHDPDTGSFHFNHGRNALRRAYPKHRRRHRIGHRISVQCHDLEGVSRQSEAANLGRASIQDVKQNSLAPLDPDRFSMAEHPSVDRERPIADLITVRHTLGQRGFHGRLALFFEGLNFGWGQEILRHVATTAESWLKLLEHEKHFAIVSTRLVLRFDVHGPNFAAILSGRKVCTRAVMRVIKAQGRRPWCEHDPPFALRRNRRRAFLECSVYVGGHRLTVPMQLLRSVGFVIHVDCRLLAFFEAKQWPWELPVVCSGRDDPIGGDLNRRRFDVQRVIRGPGLRRRSG